MKTIVVCFVICVMITPVPAGCNYKNDASEEILNDSFMHHYNRLDSIITRTVYDTSSYARNSIKYMEKLTSIKAHSDGDYIGWKPFTRRDLICWKEWYDKNKKSIK